MESTVSAAVAAQGSWLKAKSDPNRSIDLTVGVAASFTAEPIEPYLGLRLLSAGSNAAVRFANFNQIHQVCLDPKGTVGMVDSLIIVWRIEDIFLNGLKRFLDDDPDAGDEIVDDARQLGAAIGKLADSASYPVIAGAPPLPRPTLVDPLDSAATVRLSEIHARALGAYLGALRGSQARIADHGGWEASFGSDAARDHRTWLLYKQPYSNGFCRLLGEQLGDVLLREMQPAPKCIVLDCDNTLWGGIIGEDGLGGIDLGTAPPGNGYRDFQEVLRSLRHRGILLAIASKNNPDEVDEVFKSHDAMVLSFDDISVWKVSWQPKSASISEIASELNIGVDSIVFIDDSQYEIAEVTAALPQVTCLQAPDDPATLAHMVQESGLFRNLRVSEEDLKRTEMVAAERLRTASAAMTDGDFLGTLGLEVAYLRAAEEHVGRIAQLTNKTNQFNLTTVRRSEAEIRALIDSNEYAVRAIRVSDRFGDYGLVGVGIIERSNEAWQIDTLLMSCRVLGRGVETAFIHALVAEAMALGAPAVLGRFVATAKNAQVEDLYPRHGFMPVGDGTYRLAADDELVESPAHISIV